MSFLLVNWFRCVQMFTLSYFLFFGGWGASRLKLMVVCKTFEIAHGNVSCRVNLFVFLLVIDKSGEITIALHIIFRKKREIKPKLVLSKLTVQKGSCLDDMGYYVIAGMFMAIFVLFCAGLPR